MLSKSAFLFDNEVEEIDRSLIAGIGGALLLIGLGVAFGGKLLAFVDPLSMLVVLGGTLGATFANYSTSDLTHAWKALKSVFFTRVYHPVERMQYLLALSHKVKRNGLLILEREAQNTEDSFLRLALELTVDTGQQGDIRRILETEMRIAHERAMRAVQVFETMANYAPAMGLIGTLIGLIQMLDSLQNPSLVGPAMALALVTTFYGAILANILFQPIAGKLRNRGEEAAMVKAISIEAAISMSRQESPVILEQKLQSFLPLVSQG